MRGRGTRRGAPGERRQSRRQRDVATLRALSRDVAECPRARGRAADRTAAEAPRARGAESGAEAGGRGRGQGGGGVVGPRAKAGTGRPRTTLLVPPSSPGSSPPSSRPPSSTPSLPPPSPPHPRLSDAAPTSSIAPWSAFALRSGLLRSPPLRSRALPPCARPLCAPARSPRAAAARGLAVVPAWRIVVLWARRSGLPAS